MFLSCTYTRFWQAAAVYIMTICLVLDSYG